MPSSSSPRGLRVVQEMEYCKSGYSCRSMSISVDFPHPEGALITMKRGFVCMAGDSIPQANGEWKMENRLAAGPADVGETARLTQTALLAFLIKRLLRGCADVRLEARGHGGNRRPPFRAA